MSSTVEQIKTRLDIADVIASYIKIDKAGKNYRARCPFHTEKTPSFFISPDRGSYYCFGCNASGDIFSFVEQFEGVDFMGALKILAERAGIEINPTHYADKDPHAVLYEIVERARQFFVEQLSRNSDAQAYITQRGMLPETAQRFSLGYAPADWRQLFDHLTRAGYKESDILTAGLIKRKEGSGAAGSHPYDVFRNRIMFPVFDSSGRPVAFSGRVLGPEGEHIPKYLNSPETPLFKKSELLYGLNVAKQSIRQHNFSILVEGQIDLVMAHQSGFDNTIAVMGTAFTPAHASKIKRFSTNIAIALDGDSAGLASALRTARVTLAEGMDVKVVALPEGKDPADVIREDKEQWRAAVRSATHIVDFLLTRIVRDEQDSRKRKQKIQKDIFPFIAAIPNAIDRAHFVASTARVMNVDESVVEQEIRRLPTAAYGSPSVPQPQHEAAQAPSKHDRLVRLLTGIMLWQEKDATSGEGARLQERLVTLLGSDPREFFDEQERDLLAFESEVAYAGSAHIDRLINEMTGSLEEELLKRRFAELTEQLAAAEQGESGLQSLEILEQCKKISARLDELKNKKYVDN